MALEQKYQYNDIELTNDFGLMINEARYRTLDPQIGRWQQLDPEVEQFYAWTPYNSNLGNPIRYEDKDGDFPWPIIIGIALWLAAEPAVAPTNNPQADKQAVDEMRQRHDDQVIGAIRLALSAPNQTVSTAVSAVNGIRSGNNKGNNTTNKTEGDEPVVITISKDKYPENAKHVEEATAKGHPNTGQIDRAGAANRRKDSLKNVPKEKGKDRDEFPPAVLDVGGKGASIKYVNPSDNRGAGSSMGNQMKKLPDGTKVKIIVKDK